MGLSKIIISSLFKNAGVNISDSDEKDILIHDPSFFTDVLFKGSLGFGDSYMNNKWDSKHIDDVVSKILLSGIYQKLSSIYNLPRNIRGLFVNFQDRQKAKEVVDIHYNLPVDFYKSFLDPSLQYTCGFFDETNDLTEAQEKKMDLICKKLELSKGDKVLDIGGGWGGLAKFMQEKYGVRPTVVTLSEEQAKYIRKSQNEIEVIVEDYREIPSKMGKQFDSICSVGIFEHIGHRNYEKFMDVVNRSLKKGGKFLLHTLFTHYSKPSTNPWLNKHIFPNGELPPLKSVNNSLKKYFSEHKDTNLSFQELTPHYFKTLHAWNNNLNTAIKNNKIKLSEKEKRKWEFYFMSCAGAIKARHIRVGQFLYEK